MIHESIDDVLAHFGVKGMHWGIRKSEAERAEESSKVASYSNQFGFTSARANAEAISASKEKSLAKLELYDAKAPETPTGRLTPGQKKALIYGGIGALAVGGLIGYSYYSDGKVAAWAGKPIGPQQFNSHVDKSINSTWGLAGYIQKSSFDRPEFELPAGHTFHRISTSAEATFAKPPPRGSFHATYATASIADFNRYATHMPREIGKANLHHVTFISKEAIQVPNLRTNLDTLRDVMRRETGKTPSEFDVRQAYQGLSGGSWNGPRARAFFSELSGKGYGAIVDEMDAGVIGDRPLVVFSTNLTSKQSKPITDKAMSIARSSLTELTNRKL